MDITINKTTSVGSDGAQNTPEPGHLELYSDDMWLYGGSGDVTPEQVAARIIHLEAERTHDPTLMAMDGNQDAAGYVAHMALANNPSLSQNPSIPVPVGQTLQIAGGMTLKQMLAPFAKDPDKLRSALQSMERATVASPQNKTIGAVYSQGLGLPWDPNL